MNYKLQQIMHLIYSSIQRFQGAIEHPDKNLQIIIIEKQKNNNVICRTGKTDSHK